MKNMILGACLLAGGLFLPNDAHADTVYTYTVYSYSAPVYSHSAPVLEPYTYEVSAQDIFEYLDMVHGEDMAYNGAFSKPANGTRSKIASSCVSCHGRDVDQVVVTGTRITRVPPSIPVIIPLQPVYGPITPIITTTPVTLPPPPPLVTEAEEEEEECTPEMDLLAQQMRKALEDAGATLSEIGGLLFVNADGSLGVSPWVRGEPVTPTTNSVVAIFSAVVPTGATVIGGWHTHPTGTWDHDPATGAYTQAGQYFSLDDYSIANPEYVGIRNGEAVTSITRGLPGWLGLGLALNTPRRSGLYFLSDDAFENATDRQYSEDTIMEHAIDISDCGL